MNSEAAIIAQVIEHYGAYSAALERRYVQAQQRQPAPESERIIPAPRRVGNNRRVRDAVAALLRADRREWTTYELTEALGVSRSKVYTALVVLQKWGEVSGRKAAPMRGQTVSKYRWRRES